MIWFMLIWSAMSSEDDPDDEIFEPPTRREQTWMMLPMFAWLLVAIITESIRLF